MRPLVCNYYVTLKCNDSCEFCPHWQENSPAEESSLEQVRDNLRGLKSLGVLYLDITGGEPLLRDDLPEILAYAKKLKLFTAVTTNCMLFPEKGEKVAKLCDRLLFSLDFPDKEQHNRSRDEDLFDRVVESIKIAKSFKKKPIINYTITRDSVRFLPEMEDFARKHNLLVWLNPVYESPAHEGLTKESIYYVKYFIKKKHVAGNLAALKLLSNYGNNLDWPVCKAARACVTITPDSHVVAPCYFNQKTKIKIDCNLKEIFHSEEYKNAFQYQGRSSRCSGCLIWGYMLPSFWFRLDRYFFMNLYSNWMLLLKEYILSK
ncbi:MAG: radical SAM protein [Candidatus Margulisbacteria bacterium]|nr:radical SAM protein [Candidatus Margulisiibacteriota bacterium]MBU1022065.1 radical SAM protein [Candidatus Margulisiibacteriota bacterium]MBU1729660.1 radical SAM protein [Candidatus Margulisiibacteriota bacterium]MBU1954980.1 radical SAM protein [Candidatus Margulisiibacteriota bacterium]